MSRPSRRFEYIAARKNQKVNFQFQNFQILTVYLKAYCFFSL